MFWNKSPKAIQCIYYFVDSNSCGSVKDLNIEFSVKRFYFCFFSVCRFWVCKVNGVRKLVRNEASSEKSFSHFELFATIIQQIKWFRVFISQLKNVSKTKMDLCTLKYVCLFKGVHPADALLFYCYHKTVKVNINWSFFFLQISNIKINKLGYFEEQVLGSSLRYSKMYCLQTNRRTDRKSFFTLPPSNPPGISVDEKVETVHTTRKWIVKQSLVFTLHFFIVITL